MNSGFLILFWGCFGILIYIYAGYILLLRLLARWFSFQHEPDRASLPPITLLFAAHDERVSLPAKLESIRRLNYPREKLQVLIASDASTDGTVEFLASQPDVEWIDLRSHGGKNAALNELLPKATGKILFFTDANTLFHPDSLRAAASHFHDPRVGVVVGELTYTQGVDWNAVGKGAGLYWRYENTIKQYESRLGSLLVGGGALLSVRREGMERLDPRIANDLEIPARAGARGLRVLYEPRCLGYEKAHTRIREEWRRTSRIVARGLRGMIVLLPVLCRTPMRFWQFISHKFLRWLTLPLFVGMLAGAWGLQDEGFPKMVLECSGVGIVAALMGLAALPFRPASRWIRPFTLLAHLLIMHAAAVWGLCKAITGRTPAVWTVPQSTRE